MEKVMTIKEKAINAIEKIKAQQWLLTHPSRSTAVKNLETVINSTTMATDQEIVDAFINMSSYIKSNPGYFSVRGEEGSSFLTIANDFIKDAVASLEKPFDLLPNEMVVHIFSFFKIPQLNTIAQVSSGFLNISHDASLQKQSLVNHYHENYELIDIILAKRLDLKQEMHEQATDILDLYLQKMAAYPLRRTHQRELIHIGYQLLDILIVPTEKKFSSLLKALSYKKLLPTQAIIDCIKKLPILALISQEMDKDKLDFQMLLAKAQQAQNHGDYTFLNLNANALNQHKCLKA
jgi:hypothetical protein